MNILGPDALVFGVDDVDGCTRYLLDYGLKGVDVGAGGGRFEALDGTAVVLCRRDDPALPPVLGPGPAAFLRETVYGVADAAALDAIGAELSRDRAVRLDAHGVLHSTDDSGFALAFQRSVRRPYSASAALGNAPGAALQRPMNDVGADPHAEIAPRTLSHVVYLVPDAARAEAFYVDRLGFRVTDRFQGVGPFLRPTGSSDHHCLFLIETPHKLLGLEHFTFHLGSAGDVMQAGSRFVAKGHRSFWGPGRHLFGSNWFWYFDSPLGCKVEYDADMDRHDDAWAPRETPIDADSSQLFLFESRPKWAPGGPPPT